MNLKTQRKIAARILNVGLERIKFDTLKLPDIKEAITRADITSLINKGIIKVKPVRGVSRFRARKILRQKRKGRRKGKGSRSGSRYARLPRKENWMNHVRLQRRLIQLLRDNNMITKQVYRDIYMKVKGGFFRSKRHLNLYLETNNLIIGGKDVSKVQKNKRR